VSDNPDRAELIAARADLRKQLQSILYPLVARDYNPQLAAKLQAMIGEIDSILADRSREG
jgi:hypothetical protein